MLKPIKLHFLSIIIFALLGLSCWNSSPTSDKTKSYTVGGKVTDKNGAGIRDVLVLIEGTNFSTAKMTDSGGVFSFDDIKSGDYNVRASKDKFFFRPSAQDITVNSADIDTVHFTSADNIVHGYVLDITMKGIEGVTVILEKTDVHLSTVGSAISDSNGEYCFYDIEPNKYWIWCGPIYESFRNYGRNYVIELAAFNSSEIVAHNFYFSSEKLSFTKVEFSEETKTLSMEWTPSKSEFVQGYYVNATNIPGGFSKIESDFWWGTDNKASVKVTSQRVMGLFDKDVISGVVYLSVRAAYSKDDNYFRSYSPGSDEAAVRVSW